MPLQVGIFPFLVKSFQGGIDAGSILFVGHAVWVKKNCVPLTDGDHTDDTLGCRPSLIRRKYRSSTRSVASAAGLAGTFVRQAPQRNLRGRA